MPIIAIRNTSERGHPARGEEQIEGGGDLGESWHHHAEEAELLRLETGGRFG
jgi:hypothetical protein